MPILILVSFLAFLYMFSMFYFEGGFDFRLVKRMFWTLIWFVVLLYLINAAAIVKIFYRLLSVEKDLENGEKQNMRITDYIYFEGESRNNDEKQRFCRRRLNLQ